MLETFSKIVLPIGLLKPSQSISKRCVLPPRMKARNLDSAVILIRPEFCERNKSSHLTHFWRFYFEQYCFDVIGEDVYIAS